MSNTYRIQLEKLCETLALGEITGSPEELSGGFLHKTFAVQTTRQAYVIKALNPEIMKRPDVMRNYVLSERIAKAAAVNVPSACAKVYNGTFMQELDGQYYMIFDRVDGRSLQPNEIDVLHCEKMGAVLAGIHKTDYSGLGFTDTDLEQEKLIDWKYYLQKGKENRAVWADPLETILEELNGWNIRLVKAWQLLASHTVPSHRDLDPKNVLWVKDNPVVIDWEAAGFIHPIHDLIETAVNWATDGEDTLRKERFTAFIEAYQTRYGKLQADWDAVLDKGFSSRLGWLEYNLKRSLWIECTDKAEQEMGTDQVIKTIDSIRHYADDLVTIRSWLKKR